MLYFPYAFVVRVAARFKNVVRMTNINLTGKTILITGVAGFIGSSLAIKLLKSIFPINIIGVDNLNDYYDISLKEYRLNQIQLSANGPFYTIYIKASS